MINRFMRVLVFFDLPTSTKKARKAYSTFRKSLIKNGFYMVQYSVYSKTTRNSDDAEKNTEILRQHLPPKGNVRVMTVTDKQYAAMKVLVGEKTMQENLLDTSDIIEL